MSRRYVPIPVETQQRGNSRRKSEPFTITKFGVFNVVLIKTTSPVLFFLLSLVCLTHIYQSISSTYPSFQKKAFVQVRSRSPSFTNREETSYKRESI